MNRKEVIKQLPPLPLPLEFLNSLFPFTPLAKCFALFVQIGLQVLQDDLELMTFCLHHPNDRDYRCVSPCLANCVFSKPSSCY